MSRIGLDVGGTNTDAVFFHNDRVVAALKTPTTADVFGGVEKALSTVLEKAEAALGRPQRDTVEAVIIGTTHFTNAVIERRHLDKVAAVRIGLPANAGTPPFIDWPDDIRDVVRSQIHMVAGGHEFDGRRIAALDRERLAGIAREIDAAGLRAVAITSVFSPLDAGDEEEARDILSREAPDLDITLSHELGRIGLLERENVALLNASLRGLARKTTDAFRRAIAESGLTAPLYLSQNDGTIIREEAASRFPVYCFASGPTNSMRGAAFLSGLRDAIVVDVGGTTSDIGCLRGGFPREANAAVEVGGVRTLFRMPDLLAIGLGGGTIIADEGARIGPQSVGYRLLGEGRVFGGQTLTATDIAVASGWIGLGEADRLADLPHDIVDRAARSFLVPADIPGISEVIRVEHADVANAVGAAIAQIGGEVDQIFVEQPREQALAEAQAEAVRRAVEAGADPDTIDVLEIEDIPLSYMPGNALRVRVRVVGDSLRRASAAAA
jgi:N-methylhydantoinase A/oxoprolinase/acetone carboxylase beta subunit